MPFCKKCGNQLDDDAEFCPNCGTPSVISANDTGQDYALSSDHISPSSGTQKDDGGSYGIASDNLPNGYELENGRYRIEKRVGTGGFATVYKAIDTRQDKIRAVKVFSDLSDDDEYALDQLRKEADLMDSITDDRIIRFYDLNLKSTPKYLVMEYIDGDNLEGLFVRSGGKLTEKRALDIAIEIAKGMKLVHSKGIIHKDLTPRNIMFMKDGNVKIMDFGISEAMQTSRSRLDETSRAGTALYMSPEQIIGKNVGPEADIWSFGVILHQVLTGKTCFTGTSRDDVLTSIKGHLDVDRDRDTKELMQYGKMEPIEGFSSKTNELICKCLTYDYKKRLPNFEQVLDFIQQRPVAQASLPKEPVMLASLPATGRMVKPEEKPTQKPTPTVKPEPAAFPEPDRAEPKKSKVWILLSLLFSVFVVLYFAVIQPSQQEEAQRKQREVFVRDSTETANLLAAEKESQRLKDDEDRRRRTAGALSDGPLPGMKFALIPGGSFQMGSPSNESGRYDSEGPQHRVTLNSFQMMTTEVTQGMWFGIMGNNPSNFKGDNLPVEQVSWDDCQDFLKKLNQRDPGKTYRLPTEAEWEYACRAGTTTRFSSGSSDSDLDRVGWYVGNSGREMHPVGQKPPNAWGLYDMHGNVFEWCQDWRGDYQSVSVTDPRGPSSGSARVRRGGSWSNDAQSCRSAFRGNRVPSARRSSLGFRLLRSL